MSRHLDKWTSFKTAGLLWSDKSRLILDNGKKLVNCKIVAQSCWEGSLSPCAFVASGGFISVIAALYATLFPNLKTTACALTWNITILCCGLCYVMFNLVVHGFRSTYLKTAPTAWRALLPSLAQIPEIQNQVSACWICSTVFPQTYDHPDTALV